MPRSNKICDTLETTLGIIKPDGICRRDKILRKIKRNGFYILYNKKFQLSPELAADFLKEKENDPNFNIFVYNLSNGPIEVLILSKENAINDFLALIGPEEPSKARCYSPNSIRAEFGSLENDYLNAIHGSCNKNSARKEIHFFHPDFIYEPIERIESIDDIVYKYPEFFSTLIEGLHNMTKEKPDEPIIWLSKWLSDNNKNIPTIMTTSESKINEKTNYSKESSSTSVCNSFESDSISSILNSVIGSTTTFSNNTVLQVDQQNDESSLGNVIHDIGTCVASIHNPCICPKCKKIIKVPNFDMNTSPNSNEEAKEVFSPEDSKKSQKLNQV
ncbi:nucleoside diphosphate kinase homolog 5 [Condylostylus longicornis]|uniref:nucleoside diphosphate kinase homolog 5 n=1 Tax=Condylostylus longicornis TaxID=2530218 RepID=UPI00244E0D5F|nr:nucleoside diphosphate kinase homolog 5 [Condylostylus longicornis]